MTANVSTRLATGGEVFSVALLSFCGHLAAIVVEMTSVIPG
jgi:hypothetical protein